MKLVVIKEDKLMVKSLLKALEIGNTLTKYVF